MPVGLTWLESLLQMAHAIQWPLALLGQPALWLKVAQAQSGIRNCIPINTYILNWLLRHILMVGSQTLSQHPQLVLLNQSYSLVLGQTSGTLTSHGVHLSPRQDQTSFATMPRTVLGKFKMRSSAALISLIHSFGFRLSSTQSCITLLGRGIQ